MRIFGNTNLETIRILILHVNMRTSLFGDIEFWNIDFEFAVNELLWVFTPAIAFWQCYSVSGPKLFGSTWYGIRVQLILFPIAKLSFTQPHCKLLL